jgi:hypothetical protein
MTRIFHTMLAPWREVHEGALLDLDLFARQCHGAASPQDNVTLLGFVTAGIQQSMRGKEEHYHTHVLTRRFRVAWMHDPHSDALAVAILYRYTVLSSDYVWLHRFIGFGSRGLDLIALVLCDFCHSLLLNPANDIIMVKSWAGNRRTVSCTDMVRQESDLDHRFIADIECRGLSNV